MDFFGIFSIVMYQLTTARDAPLPVIVASIVVALIVWRLTKWRSAAVILNLKRGIVRRDAELTKLRAHIPMGADAGEGAVDPAGRRAGPSSDERKALRLVVNAIDQAELALRSDDTREADRAMATMAFALQTVNRVFGLPVPGLAASLAENLAAGRAYLDQVRPALRADDAEEARRAAVAFLAQAEVTRLNERAPPGRVAG